MQIKRILLDMDGVLAQFVEHACTWLDCHDKLGAWPPGEYDMAKALNIAPDELWPTLDRAAFWHSIPPYPTARRIYDFCRSVAPVTISTAPLHAAVGAAEKIEWLRRNIHPRCEYMLGGRKDLMARPDVLLIDDSDDYVDYFRAAGGIAILYPRPWNRAHAVAAALAEEDREAWLAGQLAEILTDYEVRVRMGRSDD